MRIPILASGGSWLVVAKPSGIVVHRNEWSYDHQIALLQLVRDQIGMQVNPVHRLDAGTSGCLIFATDSPTSAMIQEIAITTHARLFASVDASEAMQKEDARKTYYAFCRGDASWIGNRTESRPIKDDKGIVRDATTLLECVGACDDDSVPPEIGLRSSLLVARPVTGRWHQIRRHMNGLAHPVLNDAKHGDSRVNRWWRARYNLSGLGLHCAEVKLSLPNGELLHAECPVRRDLTKIWSQLPWWEQAQQHLPLVSASDPWDVDSVAELAAMIAEADEAAKSKRKRRVRTESA